jgi:hypothetical protein
VKMLQDPVNIMSTYNLLVNYKNFQKPTGWIYNNSEGDTFGYMERKARPDRDIPKVIFLAGALCQ